MVNYREQDFAEVYKDPSKHFDIIVDLIGGQLLLVLANHYCQLEPYLLRHHLRVKLLLQFIILVLPFQFLWLKAM